MDWDLRGNEVEQDYASFGHRRLPLGLLWNLSLATASLPPRHVGYMVWLTTTAHTTAFCPSLQRWAIELAHYLGVAKVQRKRRLEPLARGYTKAWGRRAALDGLIIGLFDRDHAPGSHLRGLQYQCDKDAFRRIRDFIAGAVVQASNQFRSALMQARSGNFFPEDEEESRWSVIEQNALVRYLRTGHEDLPESGEDEENLDRYATCVFDTRRRIAKWDNTWEGTEFPSRAQPTPDDLASGGET